MIQRNPTREVKIGRLAIGGGHPLAVQSMCATPTTDLAATAAQIALLQLAGADVIRLAVDNKKDADALIKLRQSAPGEPGHQKTAWSVDLQENYRLASHLAPHVDKIRYNPGHLYHHERAKPWRDKVQFLAETAERYDCALRVGVNAGSVDPDKLRGAQNKNAGDSVAPMVASALEHSEWLDAIGFTRYCVSLKDSDPYKVIDACRRFAGARADIPLHLGVTEAGMPPEGVEKTRIAFEQLIGQGIGDTVRVSLTVPSGEKHQEITCARKILADINAGRVRTVVKFHPDRLNLIACPSCSRVENEAFINLAQEVKTRTRYAEQHALTIAVMGCRVNGPGETDDADLGLWCGPNYVNLKKRGKKIGAFKYDEILDRLDRELRALIN